MKTLIIICSFLVLFGCVKVDKTNYVEATFVVQHLSEGEVEVCAILKVVINNDIEEKWECLAYPEDKIPQITIRWKD